MQHNFCWILEAPSFPQLCIVLFRLGKALFLQRSAPSASLLMIRRCARPLQRARRHVSPLELFMQVQVGVSQNPSQLRTFILQHFREEITANLVHRIDSRR